MKKEETNEFLQVLKIRFDEHKERHSKIYWEEVEKRLLNNQNALESLWKMEHTGGEPDLVVLSNRPNDYLFVDCAVESPIGRRNVCYDDMALEARKKNKPDYSALGVAKDMGIRLLTEEEYRSVQELFPFDLKTSSWILTPDSIRRLGGALFCDRRYDAVFVYHNGADSYYGARGFRGILEV